MVNLYSCPQPICSTPLQQGDYVRYIGSDLKTQQEYGNQDLCILAIDLISGITVCDNQFGQQLVGVFSWELQRLGTTHS